MILLSLKKQVNFCSKQIINYKKVRGFFFALVFASTFVIYIILIVNFKSKFNIKVKFIQSK